MLQPIIFHMTFGLLNSSQYITEDFFKPKIMYSEIVREPQFYLDNECQFFPEATVFILSGEHLEYLTNILNFNVVALFFRCFYAGGGLGEEGYRYKKQFLINLPIPKPNSTDIIDEQTYIELFNFDENEKNYLSTH